MGVTTLGHSCSSTLIGMSLIQRTIPVLAANYYQTLRYFKSCFKTTAVADTLGNILVHLLLFRLLPFRLLQFCLLLFRQGFIWCFSFCMPLLMFWGYSFKEHPLTSYDVQIPKSKVLLFLEAFLIGTWYNFHSTLNCTLNWVGYDLLLCWIDEMVVDKTGVDEPGINHTLIHQYGYYLVSQATPFARLGYI